MFEAMEKRVCLSATMAGGTMVIAGTEVDDRIVVTQRQNTIIVDEFRVRVGRVGHSEFGMAAIQQVRISARGGNDTIRVDPSVLLPVGIFIDAGTGNDMVNGGSGADTILGGDGRDTLFGQGGDNVLTGGAGNDLLIGGAGHDTLRGADGRDVLSGNDGDDLLFGGLGDDVLRGGNGQDVLRGEDGNDLMYGGTGDDVLSGGSQSTYDFADGGVGRNTQDGTVERFTSIS